MAAITWANVSAIVPSMALVTNVTAQDAFLRFANETVQVGKLDGEEGIKTLLARCFIAAHFGYYWINNGDGDTIAGPVIGEATGDVSRQYAMLSNLQAYPFSTTSYGQQYEQIVRLAPGTRLPRTYGAGRR